MASTSESNMSSEEIANMIEKFCSVTGSDPEKARQMLDICNWNLETAINMHVDSDFQENVPSEPVNGVGVEDSVRPPIPPSRAVLVEEEINYHYGLRGRKRRPHSVFDGFRDFRAEAELQEQTADSSSGDSLKKRRTLEDLFRPPLDLMHRGNFESARDVGQTTNRWLMVNLQDSQEFSCQVLNRDVWSNPDVKQVVSKNFVFWQVYSDSSDGQRYMQFYKPVEFPYIAVLDPRTGEKLAVWHNVDSQQLCDLVDIFLKHHSTPDGSSSSCNGSYDEQLSSKQSLLDESEEAQLKAALEASMKDNHPVNVDDDSDLETFDSDTEKDSESFAFEKDSNKSNLSVHSEQSNETIDVVNENSNHTQESSESETWKEFLGSDDDPKSNLVLRLPDGKKEQISWPCSTKVKALLLYTGELGYDPQQYELVTNFPRRNLCHLDMCKSLKEVDLFPREMIFVQLKS